MGGLGLLASSLSWSPPQATEDCKRCLQYLTLAPEATAVARWMRHDFTKVLSIRHGRAGTAAKHLDP